MHCGIFGHGCMRKRMIVKMGEQILTIHEAPVEDDAFKYSPNYDGWCEVVFTKDGEDNSTTPE